MHWVFNLGKWLWKWNYQLYTVSPLRILLLVDSLMEFWLEYWVVPIMGAAPKEVSWMWMPCLGWEFLRCWCLAFGGVSIKCILLGRRGPFCLSQGAYRLSCVFRSWGAHRLSCVFRSCRTTGITWASVSFTQGTKTYGFRIRGINVLEYRCPPCTYLNLLIPIVNMFIIIREIYWY